MEEVKLNPDINNEEDALNTSGRFSIYTSIGFAIAGLLSVYACYELCTAPIDWGFDIDWNCFNSPKSYGALCVVGFFLQFMKGGWMHTTTEEYVGVVNPDTGKPDKWEKNNDVLTVLFNSVIWPLIMHLCLIPMMYGAAMWYALMGAVAFVGKLTPYILSAAILALTASSYIMIKKRASSSRRNLWLFMAVLFCGFIASGTIYSVGLDWNSSSEEVFEPTFPVVVTADRVNLRYGPGTEYDKFKEQALKNDVLQVVDEEGDWYKVYYLDTALWINKQFCNIMDESDDTASEYETTYSEDASRAETNEVVPMDTAPFESIVSEDEISQTDLDSGY